MTWATTAIVVAGLALAAASVRSGFDAISILLLALVALLGAVAVAAALKTRSGSVKPARCGSCGGLVSPNVPYCNHCGAPLQHRRS